MEDVKLSPSLTEAMKNFLLQRGRKRSKKPATILSSSSPTGPDKVAYPMLKHLPRSDMDCLLHIFSLFWSFHSFPFIWKTSSIISIHKMGKPLDSPASFRPISLTSYVSKLFERIILSRLLFFLESNSILSPHQANFTLDGLLYIKFCSFLSPFRMGLTNPGRALGRSCLLLISPKLLTLSGTLPFSTNLFQLTSLLALLVGLNLSFLIGVLVRDLLKSQKSAPFESVDVFCKDPFLALYFSLFFLPASLPSSVSCSLYVDDLAMRICLRSVHGQNQTILVLKKTVSLDLMLGIVVFHSFSTQLLVDL